MVAFRWSMLNAPPPPWWALAWSAIAAIGLFVLGAAVFRRTERKIRRCHLAIWPSPSGASARNT